MTDHDPGSNEGQSPDRSTENQQQQRQENGPHNQRPNNQRNRQYYIQINNDVDIIYFYAIPNRPRKTNSRTR